MARTSDGKALRILNIIDEHTRECLASVVTRKIRASEVIETLTNLFRRRCQHIRSDNGPEFTGACVSGWGGRAKTLFIELAAPGRTGISRASTGRCETNDSTESCATLFSRRRY